MLSAQFLFVSQTKTTAHIHVITAKGQYNWSRRDISYQRIHGEVFIIRTIVKTFTTKAHLIDGYKVIGTIEDASTSLPIGH